MPWLAIGQDAEAVLGPRGGPWDTQPDMFLALIGALAGLALLSEMPGRQIASPTSSH